MTGIILLEERKDLVQVDVNEKILRDYGWYFEELNRFCVSTDTWPSGRLGYVLNLNNLGVNTVMSTASAFTLLEPSKIPVCEENFISTDNIERVVVRTIVPKADIEAFLLNKKSLLPYLYSMVESLKKFKGYGPETLTAGNFYATFRYPGSSKQFVREVPGGDLELRLYSDCNKVEVKE